MKRNLFFLILTGLSLFYSCATADELKSSPTVVNLDGGQVSLDVFLTRDFMPPGPSDGNGLQSVVQLQLIVGPEILGDVHFVRQYVVYNNEVWAADLWDVTIHNSYIEAFSNGGPKWGPNEYADVILEFTYKGTMYRVQAPHQYIEKVE